MLASAQETAERAVREANEAAAKTRADIDDRVRDLLKQARETTGGVKAEGSDLVGDLREMSASLRANAELLLRDIQTLHSSMTRQIERLEADRRSLADSREARAPSARARFDERGRAGSGRTDAPRERPGPPVFDQGDELDVPEFMP